MQNFFLPEINGLLGIFLIVLILVFVLKEVKNRRRGKVKVEIDGPYIELGVKPVSEGDEVRYTTALWPTCGTKRNMPNWTWKPTARKS